MRVYEGLTWEVVLPDRPYVFLNMVSTLDGKTVSSDADSPIRLGSSVDKQAMRDLEASADAVVIGRKTLSATPGLWYEDRLLRYVVTNNPSSLGNGRFFTDSPQKAWIVTSEAGAEKAGKALNVLTAGTEEVDLAIALQKMRHEHGVRVLALEGGSTLNGSFFREGFVDEIYLTMAPRIKLGTSLPTVATGIPFPEELMPKFKLVSHFAVDDELFLRYRRVSS